MANISPLWQTQTSATDKGFPPKEQGAEHITRRVEASGGFRGHWEERVRILSNSH